MIRAILQSVEFADKSTRNEGDPLEHFRVEGTTYYDFSKLNDEMQTRYQFELTDSLVKALFSTRNENLGKKTKLGKIRYVITQMIEQEIRELLTTTPKQTETTSEGEAESDLSEQACSKHSEEDEKLDTSDDYPVSQRIHGSPKSASKDHDFQWKTRIPQKESIKDFQGNTENQSSSEEVPTVPSEMRVIEASENYLVTESQTAIDQVPESAETQKEQFTKPSKQF